MRADAYFDPEWAPILEAKERRLAFTQSIKRLGDLIMINISTVI